MAVDQTRVKICGLRSAEAALVASEAGADFLGFVFVEGVRRQLLPDEGARIISDYKKARTGSNTPRIVGLFRNQDADWVNQTARQADLDYLQLCGDENYEYMDRMVLPVLKQIRVRKGTTPEKLAGIVSPYLASNRSVVLDRYDRDTPGGSGRTFDWATAEGVANLDNVLLAGGINPENVGSAINQLSPWGIDVSTGVETDGIKDPVRIRAFIDAVRNA